MPELWSSSNRGSEERKKREYLEDEVSIQSDSTGTLYQSLMSQKMYMCFYYSFRD